SYIPSYTHLTTVCISLLVVCLFFFNDPATTEISTLSLHDALPIFLLAQSDADRGAGQVEGIAQAVGQVAQVSFTSALPSRCTRSDRKSTRLNSSHVEISYAVFCLKKKKKKT